MLHVYISQIVINAALGFDSYLVMRHGVRDETSIPSNPSAAAKFSQPIAGSDLGCYFCNDVVAPGNVLFLVSDYYVFTQLTNYQF